MAEEAPADAGTFFCREGPHQNLSGLHHLYNRHATRAQHFSRTRTKDEDDCQGFRGAMSHS
jgi:hypothetical protein